MGRNKIIPEKKKEKLSITILKKNFDKFEEFNIMNKSKLIENLLKTHFESINK